ncbi:hypothetical protein BX257_0225 [Streptomyces sp. 3212.3]|nr:hypothetical protein BX257_0225 [Streptomyces sp. 3212.3]
MGPRAATAAAAAAARNSPGDTEFRTGDARSDGSDSITPHHSRTRHKRGSQVVLGFRRIRFGEGVVVVRLPRSIGAAR